MTRVVKWGWQELSKPTGQKGPAIYAVRLVNCEAVVSIRRFLGVDREGLLTIGMTTNLERRRRQFIRGSSKGRGHSAANLLYFLSKFGALKRCFREPRYELSFRRVTDERQARRWEAKMTKEYLGRFGEGPPLTSVIPDRYAHLRQRRLKPRRA